MKINFQTKMTYQNKKIYKEQKIKRSIKNRVKSVIKYLYKNLRLDGFTVEFSKTSRKQSQSLLKNIFIINLKL